MSRTGAIIQIHWNYDHNDFGYTAPMETLENFFRAGPEKREELAQYLDDLARKCRAEDWPFRPIGT